MSEASPLAKPYPDVPQSPKFASIEEAILGRWEKDSTFQASIDQRSGADEYVFYDGPPFANGLPHYGHLLTSYVKDAIPRYQTMRGKKVDRRFGWDCHGLPAEMEAERQLGISGKAAILDFGMEKFNDVCRSSVLQYTNEWETTVGRAGRWVDFDNDYKTLDADYMESVMWAFKTLYDKGLAYEGQRVLAYCWECETPLSNFETRMDDAYRDKVDPAVTVAFELHGFDVPTKLLVWTTTPWTLPSNLAIAVGVDIDYAIYEEDGTHYVLGAGTTAKYKQQLSKATQVGSIKGSELVGRTYTPLFDFFAGNTTAFRIIPSDHVEQSEGAGSVHMAPWYGEEDYNACVAAGIQFGSYADGEQMTKADPVDAQGKYTSVISAYEGLQVFEANPKIVDDLKAAGVLIQRESYSHSYPHCWRTDTPLIYRAMSSWFVKVTEFKDRMVELNQQIDWIPDHVKDGSFGKWLEGARDWSISRNRFWGSPIPVWKSDNPEFPRVDVYGSLDELEADFGVRPSDLHRPGIDNLTRPNPDDPSGESTMRRVEDVLDCWFESGSMPFAQQHYPFENVQQFEDNFPADFIVEYVAQTRGWFYTLHVLSTALFDRPPFKTCIAHGVVLGDDGRKLSKRLRNYPDVTEVFNTLGSDATRWALFASPVLRGGDTIAKRENLVEASRQVMVPIWNAYYFLSLYGNTDGIRGTFRTDQTGSLDRYILSKTAELRNAVTSAMDAYDPYSATTAVTRYIDALNNWYVRRSRDRFWRHIEPGQTDQDKQDAYDTLHTVLTSLCRILAPLLPMITEEIYTSLTGEQSVHLTDWPAEGELPYDAELVTAMDAVRAVCSEVLSIRKAQRRRVRLPLASITVAMNNASLLERFKELIADEVNVKNVILSTDVASVGSYSLAVDPGVVGPRVGKAVQKILGAARNNEWTDNGDGTVTVAETVLQQGEFDLRFKPLDEERSRSLPGNAGVVVLDINATPELEQEGLARDLVRLVQTARRDAGLHISDRIDLTVAADEALSSAIDLHRSYIEAQTLAASLQVGATIDGGHSQEGEIEGVAVRVSLVRSEQ